MQFAKHDCYFMRQILASIYQKIFIYVIVIFWMDTAKATLKKHSVNYRNTRRFRIGGKFHKSLKNYSIGNSINNKKKSLIVKVFLELLNTVKLYHWKTHSFAQHKATDELYSSLNEHIDKFIEILLGKDESRIKMIEKKMRIIDNNNVVDFKSRIYEFGDFLIQMSSYLRSRRDSDLLNVRDEILADVNQFLYLLTFDK